MVDMMFLVYGLEELRGISSATEARTWERFQHGEGGVLGEHCYSRKEFRRGPCAWKFRERMGGLGGRGGCCCNMMEAFIQRFTSLYLFGSLNENLNTNMCNLRDKYEKHSTNSKWGGFSLNPRQVISELRTLQTVIPSLLLQYIHIFPDETESPFTFPF